MKSNKSEIKSRIINYVKKVLGAKREWNTLPSQHQHTSCSGNEKHFESLALWLFIAEVFRHSSFHSQRYCYFIDPSSRFMCLELLRFFTSCKTSSRRSKQFDPWCGFPLIFYARLCINDHTSLMRGNVKLSPTAPPRWQITTSRWKLMMHRHRRGSARKNIRRLNQDSRNHSNVKRE